jgi:hypothetical protein
MEGNPNNYEKPQMNTESTDSFYTLTIKASPKLLPVRY